VAKDKNKNLFLMIDVRFFRFDSATKL